MPKCPEITNEWNAPQDYYIFPGCTGIPLSSTRRGSRTDYTYWGEYGIELDKRLPFIADMNWGVEGTGWLNACHGYGNGKINIRGANAVFFDGHGKWFNMNWANKHYWYNPKGSKNTWGYYGNIVYPLPDS